MNSKKEKEIHSLFREALKNKNSEQCEMLLEEIILHKSIKKAKRRSRIRKITLITTCLFIFTISYSVFIRHNFRINDPRDIHADQSIIKVTNKPNHIRVRLKDGTCIEIDKRDGSYRQVFDSTLLMSDD